MKYKKIGKIIQETLSEALLELDKELYSKLQISKVEVNQKITLALVYFLGDLDFFSRVEKLNQYFRKWIAQKCNLRFIPEVRILYDFEFEKQMNALTMLDKVLKVE